MFNELIVVPESGPRCLRMLKTAVFLSSKVHWAVLNLPSIDPGAATDALLHLPPIPEDMSPADRVTASRGFEYMKFLIEVQPTVKLLIRENLVSVVDFDAFRQAVHRISSQLQSPSSTSNVDLLPLLNRLTSGDETSRRLENALRSTPPGFMDFVPLGMVAVSALTGDEQLHQSSADLAFAMGLPGARLLLFAGILAEYLVRSELSGATLATDSWLLREAAWSARLLFGDAFGAGPTGSGQKTAKRREIYTRLGQMVMANRLPRLDDLEFEELLRMRSRRAGEIEALQCGLREVASDIDPTATSEDLELSLQDCVARRIDPAVHQLRAAVEASRLDLTKKIGESGRSLRNATVPLLIGFGLGAPLDVNAAIAACSLIGLPIWESVIERRKLTHSSQWSLLLRFDSLGRPPVLDRFRTWFHRRITRQRPRIT